MKKPLVKLEKIDFILLIILFSISAFFEISTFPKGIGIDEALYWSETKDIDPIHYYLGTSGQIPFHGPLFFYTNYFIVHISNSLLAFRMPSLFFSFATILLFYIFAKALFNRKTAFIASLLLATSISFNIISIYRMPHIDYCFFSFASIFSFILALRTDEGKYLIISFLLAGIAFLINILGLTTLASLTLSLLVVKNNFIKFSKEKNSVKLKISKYTWIALGTLILLILICSPMQIIKGETIKRYNNTKNLIQTEKIMLHNPPFSLNFIRSVLFFERELSDIIIIIGIIATVIITLKNKTLLPILIYLIIYSFIMSFTQGMMWYIVPVVMFTYLFFSRATFTITEQIFSKNIPINERKYAYILTAMFIILTVLIVIMFNSKTTKNYYEITTHNNFPSYLYKEAYDYLKSKNESGIYVLTNMGGLLRYYADKDGFNATFLELPRSNLDFTLEDRNRLLPLSHHYYDYVVQLYRSTEEITNKSKLYATLQNISSKCNHEVVLNNEKFNDPNTKLFIYNCKNMTLDN
jgi:4-amino-4-deoxy-L-arabinose transferase-like glycosyltransferase